MNIKGTIVTVCVTMCLHTVVMAQETATAPAPKPTKPAQSGVVETAKATKASRKKSRTKVIRNADVRKSKGKLIAISSKPVEKDKQAPAVPSLELNEKQYRARLQAAARLSSAEKKSIELQKSLDDLEQQYYETNDPNYRDQVIQERFKQTKRQLADSKQELADARDALQKIDHPNPQ